MRLINTLTLDLEEFYGTEIPEYAILSHTWVQREEVTFQEWLRRDTDPSVQNKSGYTKILGACGVARRDSLDWLWVDTNCIDKSSSADLSEAINSMYEWYRQSAVCYAYLSDISALQGLENDADLTKQVVRSRWWTRGWTLQELLAPRNVQFFNRQWDFMDFRERLAPEIELITGIAQRFLTTDAPQAAHVSEKMSWLSKRETTRVEDIAYCMLGLFEINMPLLYGEGRKAFWRLQEEIIKVSNDHTIFCWTWTDAIPNTWASMLAPWPDAFASSSGFMALPPRHGYESMAAPYSMTNVGLSIKLPVIHTISSWFVFLDVRHTGWPKGTCACVQIRRLGRSSGHYRCQFPRSPIALWRRAAEKEYKQEGALFEVERLHDWIIASRKPPLHPAYSRNVPRNYNILLFTDEAIIHRKHDPTTIRIRSISLIAQTGKSATFNSLRNIFVLGWVRPDVYAGLWYFWMHDGTIPIYLFFAVVNATMANSSWSCGIASYKEIRHLDPHILKEDESISEATIIYCGQAWGGKKLRKIFRHPNDGATVSETQDRSLKLGIGGPLSVDCKFDLRSAYLSSPDNLDHPVPPHIDDRSITTQPGDD